MMLIPIQRCKYQKKKKKKLCPQTDCGKRGYAKPKLPPTRKEKEKNIYKARKSSKLTQSQLPHHTKPIKHKKQGDS
jgi:hypothetical protein